MAPLENVTLPLVDHPATPPTNAAPSFLDSSAIPSLTTNASIGTTTDHSTTSLIGGAPLSLVDPSALPSLITDVSMAIDHSTTPPINIAHENGNLNSHLPDTESMLPTAVTISMAMSSMDSEEPVSVHNTSAVSLLLPERSERSEPLPNSLVMELNNPVASTTQILNIALNDISAVPSSVPTNAAIAEKGPTGMTKKAGIMRPNAHSKTAR